MSIPWFIHVLEPDPFVGESRVDVLGDEEQTAVLCLVSCCVGVDARVRVEVNQGAILGAGI